MTATPNEWGFGISFTLTALAAMVPCTWRKEWRASLDKAGNLVFLVGTAGVVGAITALFFLAMMAREAA